MDVVDFTIFHFLTRVSTREISYAIVSKELEDVSPQLCRVTSFRASEHLVVFLNSAFAKWFFGWAGGPGYKSRGQPPEEFFLGWKKKTSPQRLTNRTWRQSWLGFDDFPIPQGCRIRPGFHAVNPSRFRVEQPTKRRGLILPNSALLVRVFFVLFSGRNLHTNK